MIVDKIENAHFYSGLCEKLTRTLEILKDLNPADKDDGRYDVEGDELYYLVQRYETKPIEQGRLEVHQKYIDVQFIAEGEELLGYCPLENLECIQPYTEAKDCALYKAPEQLGMVKLTKGMFCILFPQDTHMPCRQASGPSNVIKVVTKVKIDDK